MKTILSLILLLISATCFSQTYDCTTTDKIALVQGGLPTNISVEFGFQNDLLGGFVGLKAVPYTIAGNEIYPSSQSIHVNPFIKGSLHILGSGEDDFYRLYIVGYKGFGKIGGGGLKLGIIVFNDFMIFTESVYGEGKFQGNLGLSFRF